MSLICAVAGALLGAMTFGTVGMLAGGFLGWLLGTIQELRQRQGATEKELAWVRQSLAEHLREKSAAATPVPATAPSFSASVGAEQETREPERAEAFREAAESPSGAWDAVRPEEDCGPAAARAAQPHPLPEKELPPTRPEPEPRRPRQMAEPAQPSAVGQWLRNLLSGENLLVKLGVVIIFFGVSFLVKYAAQHGLFPLELRLTAAALGGCALLATGWRLRSLRPAYAQAIQGGGIGILYLTTFGALRLYHLIPAGAGLILLVTVCILSALLALLQDSRSLAFLGSAGGFLAPELSGIGSGNPALLFGYYAILNCGICALAVKRAWRELNLLGFFSTFLVSALWGSRFYTPAYLFTVEPFLVLFFLMYALLPVLYARQHPAAGDGYLDTTLVFGTPILAFAFQAALLRDYRYCLAWSALAAGSFYLSLAKGLFRCEPQRLRGLTEAFLALGVVFCSLAIPLAFEGRWTSAAWSIEGAGLVWIGLRQKRILARAFGYLLLVGSGLIFLNDGGIRSGVWPVLNSFYLGTLLVSAAALISARLLNRYQGSQARWEGAAEPLLLAWGMSWWYLGGLREVSEHTVSSLTFGVALSFVAISCYAVLLARKRLDWQLLEWPSLALLPALVLFALWQRIEPVRCPSLAGGWFAWPLALGAWYLILHALRQRLPRLPAIVHAAPFWLMTLLAAWEVSGRIARHLPGMEAWSFSVWGAAFALAVLLIARRGPDLPWPVEGNYPDYLVLGAAPPAILSIGWLLVSFTVAGDDSPLTYLPVLNPLDGTTILVLLAVFSWQRAVTADLDVLAALFPRREVQLFLAALGFLWLNALLLRSLHHWINVPYTAGGLFASLTVQAALSIFWTLSALTLMTLATKRGVRSLWIAGAGLLGAVLAKLFLVDLAGQGSIARIVSFVVVGVLILMIGWFSPVPPRSSEGGAP